jgi:hypothetical protein
MQEFNSEITLEEVQEYQSEGSEIQNDIPPDEESFYETDNSQNNDEYRVERDTAYDLSPHRLKFKVNENGSFVLGNDGSQIAISKDGKTEMTYYELYEATEEQLAKFIDVTIRNNAI